MVERPGLWMDADQLDALRRDLRAIAETVLSGSLEYGVFRRDAALDDVIVTLVHEANRPIAFNALAPLDVALGPAKRVPVLHLGLVMVDPSARSGGLSWVLYGLTCFLVFARGGFRPLCISSVTQVPAVIGMVARTFGEVVPDPSSNRRASPEQRAVARRLVTDHAAAFGVQEGCAFDADRHILLDAYRGGSDALKKSFEAAAKHREPVFNDYAARELDYERGDDVVQVGAIDLAVARRYLTAQVPPGPAWRLTVSALVAFVGSTVLPVLHWFDTSRAYGAVRARS